MLGSKTSGLVRLSLRLWAHEGMLGRCVPVGACIRTLTIGGGCGGVFNRLMTDMNEEHKGHGWTRNRAKRDKEGWGKHVNDEAKQLHLGDRQHFLIV